MRPKLNLLIALLAFSSSQAQQSITLSFDQLKEYEGIYQYLNKGSLELVALPKDNKLYAIIHEVKYPLVAADKDIFLNVFGDSVYFIRNDKGMVEAYMVNNQRFPYIKRGGRDYHTWYPRQPKYRYHRYTYKRTLSPKLNDGIVIGSFGSSGLNKKDIQEMVDKVVDESYPDIHSILLFRDNKLILEEYFYEYNRNDLHQLRSATKSFISALVGIAASQGLIKNLDEPIFNYFPEYAAGGDPRKNNITIRQLLTNTSGFDCDINDTNSVSDETRMGNSDDWVKYTLQLPVKDTPGVKGKYCSGNAIVLGKLVEKVSRTTLDEYAEKNLFKPLGIKNFKWNFKPDLSSAETFCQLYLRPRDMAKFGLLYLNKGQWQGKQIIPEEWVRESITAHSNINGTDYGYLWWLQWLNAGGLKYDGVAAKGNGGQRIYLFPAYNFMAVITSGRYNAQSHADEMLINHVLPSLRRR